jgi:HSP20 family molecular chaperone IbpA
MNVPGANRDTINIESKGNTLVATGEIRPTMRESADGNEMTRIKSERKIGKWRREIALPQKYVSSLGVGYSFVSRVRYCSYSADTSKAEAKYHDGMLEISVPKASGAAQAGGSKAGTKVALRE